METLSARNASKTAEQIPAFLDVRLHATLLQEGEE